MSAIAYIIVFRTERIPMVMNGMESLSTIWTVALSVLGLYVYKRSNEKTAPKITDQGPIIWNRTK